MPGKGAGLASFYRQHLSWSGCGGGFECSRLLVPIDYSKPRGRTMRIAVIRKQSSCVSRGSLIVNPGGPGASGLDYVRVDMEHASPSIETVADMAVLGRALGLPVIVRPPETNREWITRLLDSGVWGLHVPQIETPQLLADTVWPFVM